MIINSISNEQSISISLLSKNELSGEKVIIPLTYYGTVGDIVACQLVQFSITDSMVFIFSLNEDGTFTILQQS